MKKITLAVVAMLCAFQLGATKYEAENGTLTADAEVVADNSASGGQYVDMKNGDLTFNVTLTTGGWFLIKVAASSDNDLRAIDFQVDANATTTLVIPLNSTYNELQIGGTTYLAAGSHTLTFKKNWGYVPIDYLSLEVSPLQVYEAENAAILSTDAGQQTATSYSEAGTSGGKYLDTKGSHIEFTLNIPSAGNYKVTIVGHGDGTAGRVNTFSIDNVASTEISVEMVNSAWASYDLYSSYAFTAGTHTLKMARDWGYVGLDYLQIESLNSTAVVNSDAEKGRVYVRQQQICIDGVNANLYDIKVYDLLGALKYQNKGVSGNQIISEIQTAGAYLVVIVSDNKTLAYKIILN